MKYFLVLTIYSLFEINPMVDILENERLKCCTMMHSPTFSMANENNEKINLHAYHGKSNVSMFLVF